MGGDPLIALPNKIANGCFSHQVRQVRCCLLALMSQGVTTCFLIFPGTRITHHGITLATTESPLSSASPRQLFVRTVVAVQGGRAG